MASLFRQVLIGFKRRNNAKSSARGRPRKQAPLSTRQWLALTLGIATVVGVIFILTLYYQPKW
jgi:hypothetical protein